MRVRFSHDLVDHGMFDLGAVPRCGEMVLLPGVVGHLRVWNVAWRLDWGEPAACVLLTTELEYRNEFDPEWRGRAADPGML